jgi:hypothetical protein
LAFSSIDLELRVVDHPDPVDLPVDGVRLDVVRVEVVLDRADYVAQVGHLTALDHLQLRVELEDVRRLLGEQGGEQLGLEVVAGDPVGGHVGLGVRLRVLLDGLLRSRLAVGVEVLDELLARTGPAPTAVVAAARGQRAGSGHACGRPEEGSAGPVAVAHCRHADVLVSSVRLRLLHSAPDGSNGAAVRDVNLRLSLRQGVGRSLLEALYRFGMPNRGVMQGC